LCRKKKNNCIESNVDSKRVKPPPNKQEKKKKGGRVGREGR
jgi:hypothetical protein